MMEAIHEGEDIMIGTCIDYLIYKGCGVVVFGIDPIQIMKVYACTNGPLFFGNRDRVEHLGCVFYGKNKLFLAYLIKLCFDVCAFGLV